MEDYFTYKELYKQSEYKLLFRSPLITLMIWFLNLPTNILSYFTYLKDRRNYERAIVDVEIMKKYIDAQDNKGKLKKLNKELSKEIDKVIPYLAKINKQPHQGKHKDNNDKYH
tara:strand:- start:1300 stop:1638 length:339 start_codon:yes stop_codon:yes gene_type:complete